MESEQEDYLQNLFKRVAARVDRSPEQLEPFLQKLKKNWYDTKDALNQLQDEAFKQLQIPHRVVVAIRQQLQASSKPMKQQQSTKKQQLTKKQLNLYQIVNLVNELENALIKQCRNNQKVMQILKTLFKIIGNIVKDSYQLKFRTLKKTNKLINQTIYDHTSCLKFMKEIGFIEEQQVLYLHVPQTHQLCCIEECLGKTLERVSKTTHVITGSSYQSYQNQNQRIAHQQQVKFPSEKLTNENGLKQKFSPQKLQEINYAEGLQRLIQYRNQLMSSVPNDRKLKIYHKKYECKDESSVQYDFSQQLQKSDDQVIAQYWKQFVSQNRTNSAFQSKRKLEFQFLLKQPINKETCIKLRLPNQYIIEGRFGPLQKLQSVFSWLASIVVGDLYLYTTPPVKKMNRQFGMTLQQLDSVPTGAFYVGINSEWYIQNKYAPIIQK